ncbi:MAG TPA: FeoA family protein [Caulobacteraceae bacterium]|nr:FeoA family protein [Caulobacteraceae bacterium]
MRRLAEFDVDTLSPTDAAALAPLGEGRRGLSGVIASVRAPERAGALPPAEMERRLLEMGFVEGARIEILHEGLIGRDPICVRVDDMRVALRRRDAAGVLVRVDTDR